ncbi:MAG TPA: hypothetical protein VN455_00305 [Methanotrichaceae archaeon]|nr:hypothetical protein [Methanotrichaceae archaeon]
MKALIILVLLALAMLLPPSNGDDFICTEGGPQLIARSASASMECGRSSYIQIDLQNAGNISLKACKEPSDQREADLAGIESEYEANYSRAIGIEAVLLSRDDRIDVLSGPQVAGSLSPGQSRQVRFLASADSDLAAGVYPITLKLDYSRQSNVQISGEAGFPDVSFYYQNETALVPLEVAVVTGPKIAVQEVRDPASPGDSSELEIVLANQGDQAAEDLIIQPQIQPPFTGTSGPADLDRLDPGRSASVFLDMDTENGAKPGQYALPLIISYLDGEIQQSSETAALVQVEKHSALRSRIIRPALIALVSLLLILIVYIGLRERKDGQRWRKRF